MKKFSELIEDSVNCIRTYNKVTHTIDSHADEFLAAVSSKSHPLLVSGYFSERLTILFKF